MAVDANSRYIADRQIVVAGRTGQPVLVLNHVEAAYRSYAFTYYQWTDQDRPDLVAASFYGDDRQWWVIARANPEILDWFSVETGTLIRIPNG